MLRSLLSHVLKEKPLALTVLVPQTHKPQCKINLGRAVEIPEGILYQTARASDTLLPTNSLRSSPNYTNFMSYTDYYRG